MTIATIITAIIIYLLIGFLLSAAFQDDKERSITSVLFYPIALSLLCVLTIILFIFDSFSDTESKYQT